MLSSLLPPRGESRCQRGDLEWMSRHLDRQKEPLRDENISPEYLRSIAVELNNAAAELHNAFPDHNHDGEDGGMDTVMQLFKESVSTMMDAGKSPEQRPEQNYKRKLEMLVDAKMTVYRKRQGKGQEAAQSAPSLRTRNLRELMLFKPDSVLDLGTQCFEEAIKAQQYDDKSLKTKGSPSVSVGSAAVFNMGLLQLRRSQVEDDDGLLEAAMKLFRMSLGVAVAASQEKTEQDRAQDGHVISATSIFRDQIYAQTNLGHGLYALGSFDEAIDCFVDALSKVQDATFLDEPQPERAQPQNLRGKKNNEENIYEMAKNIFSGLEDEKLLPSSSQPHRQQACRTAAKEDVTTFALLQLNLGRTQFAKGNFSQATEACNRALKSIRNFSDNNNDEEDTEELETLRTALTYNLGFLYHEQGRHKEALQLFCTFLEDISDSHTSEAITALSKILLIQMEGEKDYDAVKEIVDVLLHLEQAQDQVGYDHVGLCSILRCVGSALMERGENNFAVRYFLEALRIERDASEDTGNLSQEVIVTLNSVGECYHMAEDLDRASEFYENALRLQDHFSGMDEDDADQDQDQRSRLKFIFSVVMYNNGRVKYELGQQEASDAIFGDAAAMVEDVSRSFQDPSRLSECAALQHNIGQYKLELGRTSDARRCFESSLKIRTTVLGRDDPAVAESLYQLGKLYHGMGDNAAALGAFAESMRIERAAFGESHPNVAMTLYNMAQIRYSACELDVALGMFKEVLKMLRSNPSDTLSLGEVYSLIGSIQGELGLVAEARASLAASARLGGGRATDDNFMCASSLVELASSRPAAAA